MINSNNQNPFNQILNERDRCILLHSLNGDILAATPKACEELGYTQEEIMQLVLANIKALELRLSDVCLKHEKDAPVIFQRRNGRRFPAKVTSQATRVLRDREEQNIVQLEFNILDEAGVEGNTLPKFDLQESADYLELLSREIKHPLIKLGMFLDSLNSTLSDPTVQGKLDDALQFHADIMELTSDVADWFKLGTNILHLDKQPFNLVGLTDSIAVELDQICRSQHCIFSLCVDSSVCELVFGDVNRVRQLIKRLILKALTIHRPNQLRLRIGSNDAQASNPDDGELNISLIVHNYSNTDDTASPQTEAPINTKDAGLGIIGKLIKIMGGQLKQHRRSDVEYEYFFTLAMPPVDTLDIQNEPRFLSQEKILLIDNDDSLLKYQLMQWGAEVEFFSNWNKAKVYLEQLGSSWPYSIKILQHTRETNLDDMLSKITAMPGATVCLDFRHQCTINDSGISYIPSPMQPGFTGNALATLLRQKLPYPYSQNHRERIFDTRDDRASILFVDDVESIRLTYKALLEKENFKVDLAQNGIDAILACDQHRYDLVIIDIQMPYMDGIEAASHIRNSKNLNRKSPILAVSGDVSENARIAIEKVGIQALHSKSSNNESLLAAIHQLANSLSTNQTFDEQTNHEQPMAPKPSEPKPVQPLLKSGRRAYEDPQTAGKQDYLNMELLKNLVADTSLDICTEMVGIFMEESKQSVAVIDEASRDQNWQKVKEEAHAIKSTSYTFGCEALYNIAALLEEEVNHGNFQKSNTIVDEMATVFSHSYLALENFFQEAGKSRPPPN